MSGKYILVFSFYFLNVALGGERTFTGNFRVDLVNFGQDSIIRTETSSVNINLRQNPFMNGLYSLAVPGVGQLRAEQYTKGAIFFTAEIVLIGYAIINNNKGDKKTKEYQAYADAHWDAERYARWINTHGVTDYGPMISFSQEDFDAIRNHKDFRKINEWESGLHKSGISHHLPQYGEQQYFELIGKYHQFKYGWDTYPQVNGIPISDGGEAGALIPQQLKDYAVERGKANDYYYAASFAASALVINHVLSAVDAFFSTRSYNKEISAAFQITPIDGIEGKNLLSEVKIQIPF